MLGAPTKTCPKGKEITAKAKRQDNDDPQPLHPPSMAHRAPSTPTRTKQHLQEGKCHRHDVCCQDQNEPRVFLGTQSEHGIHMTPYRKEWCHAKATPRQGQTSWYGFLPLPHPHNKPWELGAPPPSLATNEHASPRSCSRHHQTLHDNGLQPEQQRHMT
jgi:hypothetical protein